MTIRASTDKRPTTATPAGKSLLSMSRFRRYTLARLLGQVAQNALIYGLFISFIVPRGSSLATSAFVLVSVVPSVVLSVPGGLAADVLPKKLLLVVVLVLRLAITSAFVGGNSGIGEVLVLTLALWCVYQFFTPPENVALLAVVPSERVPAATSVLQALSLAAQVAGAGLIAPVLIKFVSNDALFYTVELLLLGSLLLYISLPHLTIPGGRSQRRTMWWRSLPQGMALIRSNSALWRMTFLKAILDAGVMMVIVAAPEFIQDVLHTGPENTVYIAIPAAIGLAIGLMVAPALVTFLEPVLVVWAGYALFVVTVVGLAFVKDVSSEVSSLAGPLTDASDFVGLSRQIFATAVILPFAGLGLSFVQVASRAGTYRVVQPTMLGQVLASQSAIGSLIALLPTLLSGLMLDVLPVGVVLIGIALSLTLLALVAPGSWSYQRAQSRPG